MRIIFFLSSFLLLKINVKERVVPFAGVVDGGDISSVRYTSVALNTQIKDNTCVCHKLNNLIKRIVGDYFGEHYLEPWRLFIKRTNKSHPFREAWFRCCEITYGEPVILQIDTNKVIFCSSQIFFIHSFIHFYFYFYFLIFSCFSFN